MASRRAVFGLAAVLVAGVAFAPVAQAAASKEAETFISGLANEALKDLSDKLPEPELEKHFKALLDKNFDMPRISRFVLGRYWNGASDKEKQDFQKALEIDKEYDESMAYMNLLIRERADLADNAEEYKKQVEIADNWVQKALETVEGAEVQSVGIGSAVVVGKPGREEAVLEAVRKAGYAAQAVA